MQPNRLQSFYIGQEHEVFTGHASGRADEQFGSIAPLSLQERQQAIVDHIKVTRDVLKEQTEELIKGEECDPVHHKKTLKEVVRRIQEQQSKSPKFANLVFQLMHKKPNTASNDMTDGDIDLSSSMHAVTPVSLPAQPLSKKRTLSSQRQLSVQSLSTAVSIATLRRNRKKQSKIHLPEMQEQKCSDGSANVKEVTSDTITPADTELSVNMITESSPVVLNKTGSPSILKDILDSSPDESPVVGSSHQHLLQTRDEDYM